MNSTPEKVISCDSEVLSHRVAGRGNGLVLSIACLILVALLFWGWSRPGPIMALDHAFFGFFSNFTHRSWAFDKLVVEIFTSRTAKMVPLLACIVWLLFERRRQGRNIAFFAQMLVGSFLAMAISRVLQNFSLYRPRPLRNPDIDYQLPFGVSSSTLEGWSSFPSDTTALGIAIAAGVFAASRRLGVAAFLWAVLVVAFPRAYAGLHYPSDLICGAVIGVMGTLGLAPLMLNGASNRFTRHVSERWWPLLWTLAALYMFQLATMFDDVRAYGSFAKDLLGL